MWFKNLFLYRFTKPFTTSPEELDAGLHNRAFLPVPRQQPFSSGWVSPLGIEDAPLVHATNGFMMICLRREERVVPAAAVRETLELRAKEIEEKTGRKVRGKARTELRDTVILEMLPRAFTRSRHTFAYIDPRDGWLVVDAATAAKAEEVTAALREALGTLPIAPLAVTESPGAVMTTWVATGKTPASFSIENECDLCEPGEGGAVIRVRKHDLDADEIRAHVEAGMRVTRLALGYDQRLRFVLDEQLNVKRLKFLDLIQEEAASVEVEDAAARFDSDFAIMSLELSRFLPVLVDAFGGESNAEARDAA